MSAGIITVSRSSASNASSASDDNSSGGEYTWTITFPLTARDVPELGVDGTALEGTGAAGNLVETQIARVPEIQQVSTSAGSEMIGVFTLAFSGEETGQLPYNATAAEVRSVCWQCYNQIKCVRTGTEI